MSRTPQPWNLTVAQDSLVRRLPPPPPPAWTAPEPKVPARLVAVDSLPPRGAARRFAKKAASSGFDVHAVASRGPRLSATGEHGADVDVVSIRCSRDGQVQIAAAWVDGKFDVAFGRRRDGSRRLAQKWGEVELWLEHGVSADEPQPSTMTARETALLLASALGASLIAAKVDGDDGTVAYICPEVANDVQADVHLRDFHGLPGGGLAAHAEQHRWPRNHAHARRPLGDT